MHLKIYKVVKIMEVLYLYGWLYIYEMVDISPDLAMMSL